MAPSFGSAHAGMASQASPIDDRATRIMQSYFDYIANELRKMLSTAGKQHSVEEIMAAICHFKGRTVVHPCDSDRRLGDGAQGAVTQRRNLDGHLVAVKEFAITPTHIRMCKDSTAAAAIVEVAMAVLQISFGLQVQRIQRFLDLSFTFDTSKGSITVQLVSELMDADASCYTYKLLHSDFSMAGFTRLSVPQLYRLAHEATSSLVELHQLDILYNDDKPNNMLVKLDSCGQLSQLCLADLGAAQVGTRTGPGGVLATFTASLATDNYLGASRVQRRQRCPSCRTPADQAVRWYATEWDDTASHGISLFQASTACDPDVPMLTWVRDVRLWSCIWAQHSTADGHSVLAQLRSDAADGDVSAAATLRRYQQLECLQRQGVAGQAYWQLMQVIAFSLATSQPTAQGLLKLLQERVGSLVNQLSSTGGTDCVMLPHADFPHATHSCDAQPDSTAPAAPPWDIQSGSCLGGTADDEEGSQGLSLGDELWCEDAAAEAEMSLGGMMGLEDEEGGSQCLSLGDEPWCIGVAAETQMSLAGGMMGLEEQQHEAADHIMSPRGMVCSDPGGETSPRAVMPPAASISYAGDMSHVTAAHLPVTAAPCAQLSKDKVLPSSLPPPPPPPPSPPAQPRKATGWWSGLVKLCWGSNKVTAAACDAEVSPTAGQSWSEFQGVWDSKWCGC